MNTFIRINHLHFSVFYGNIIDFTYKYGLDRSYLLVILRYIGFASCSLFGSFADYLTVVFHTFFTLMENVFYCVTAISKAPSLSRRLIMSYVFFFSLLSVADGGKVHLDVCNRNALSTRFLNEFVSLALSLNWLFLKPFCG